MANLLGQVASSRPIRRAGPRHYRPPLEIRSYEETIIIDSVYPLEEEIIDIPVRRGPRHQPSWEITAAMSRHVRRGPRHHTPRGSGINNNERGQELSSNLEWARVEQEEETMILGGIHEDDDDGGLMSGPLSQEIITRCLKTRNPCPEDKGEDKVCAICLDDFGQESGDEMIGVLDCRHEYHVSCITKWLTKKNFCPLCKAVAL